MPLCTSVLCLTKAFIMVNASQTRKCLLEQYIALLLKMICFQVLYHIHELLCFYMFCQYGSHRLEQVM